MTVVISDWPWPAIAFRPGVTSRPAEDDPIYAVAAVAPIRTDPALWRANRPYLFGVDLHNCGFFWEAHEMWEPVWAHARPNAPERALLQGLIQLTNACLKTALGNVKASERLATLAAAHFCEAQGAGVPVLMGLELAACAEVAKAIEQAPYLLLHYSAI